MENNNNKNLIILGETSPEWYVNILKREHNSIMNYVLCILVFMIAVMIKTVIMGTKAICFMAKKTFNALLDVYKKDEE